MSWLRRMSVRGRTVLVGSVVSIALVAVASAVPIPYVAVGPGVTFNVLGSVNGTEVITFTGEDIPASVNEPTSGNLNMTTISIKDHMTLFAALGLWATGTFSIAPREDFFPPGQTVQQVNETNAKLFADSQSAAEIAALRYLDYPAVTYVGDIEEDSPAFGVLEPQDQFVSVDDKPITTLPTLIAALAGTKPGQVVKVTVKRDDKELDEKITVADNPNNPGHGFLGIRPVERPSAPFTPHIALQNIGGPSAGLMFTLGLIDKLTPGELTGGKFIAGTGEIQPGATESEASTVGAIGGIQLKMIGARNAGASWFLVPAPNCQEAAARIPSGLQLAKVANLNDAMDAVKKISAGQTPAGC
jgi:PDZ domain-containing protein